MLLLLLLWLMMLRWRIHSCHRIRRRLIAVGAGRLMVGLRSKFRLYHLVIATATASACLGQGCWHRQGQQQQQQHRHRTQAEAAVDERIDVAP
uniref:Putative secreted protein n=1 Tax=Anopheles darlingi TaxID=43151 RepID=A0A2M4DF45_ANODA